MYVVSYSDLKFNALCAIWGSNSTTLPLLDIGRTIGGVKSYSNRIKGMVTVLSCYEFSAWVMHASCGHTLFFIFFATRVLFSSLNVKVFNSTESNEKPYI